ncbi:MAG: AlpA family phage regulatory protein [Oligoflexia bacterium]|nr:AlpA family phage regulatory protein [Oligoflexia bacterium]
MAQKILRKTQLFSMVNLSGSTIDRNEKKGEFPRRVRLSSRAVGWNEDDILDWIQKREKLNFPSNETINRIEKH